MGFISTVQHDGRLFIAGRPRRSRATTGRAPALRLPAAAQEPAWQSADWVERAQATAALLWQTGKRHLLAAVERVAQEAAPGTASPSGPVSAARPLRVLHVLDPAGGSGGGRMVISGRMADVCAELERLAAWEARHARC